MRKPGRADNKGKGKFVFFNMVKTLVTSIQYDVIFLILSLGWCGRISFDLVTLSHGHNFKPQKDGRQSNASHLVLPSTRWN